MKLGPGDVNWEDHVIRSYNCEPQDSRFHYSETAVRDEDTQTNQYGYRSNIGPTPDIEVWQVACAATAAPIYFKPFSLTSPRGGNVEYTDGSLGHDNNPTMVAKNDILGLYQEDSLGVVVSVGTARKKLDARVHKEGPMAAIGVGNRVVHTATNPEAHHKKIAGDLAEGFGPQFSYYRLNDPGGLDMDLDEWEPKKSSSSKKSGSETLEAMRTRFNEWYGDRAVNEKFKKCARELVKCRQLRSKTLRWEQYAMGLNNVSCTMNDCNIGFITSEKYKEHLRNTHGYTKRQSEVAFQNLSQHWRYPHPPSQR